MFPLLWGYLIGQMSLWIITIIRKWYKVCQVKSAFGGYGTSSDRVIHGLETEKEARFAVTALRE